MLGWHFAAFIIGFPLGFFIALWMVRYRFTKRVYHGALADLQTTELLAKRFDQFHEKIAQAYIVIGVYAHEAAEDVDSAVSEEEFVRALDYFADPDKFDPDFLPWPRKV